MPRTIRRRWLAAVAAVLLGAATAGCAGDDPPAPAAATSTPATEPASAPAPAPPPMAEVAGEEPLDPAYRQGLARVEDGWLFSFNDGLFRTDDSLQKVAERMPAIPPEWAAQGFDHLGDIDVVGDVVYAPLEQPEYELGRQVMLLYDLDTLEVIDAIEVAQHHNAWVTVDPDSGIAYSMDEFGDDAVLRYDTRDGWRPLEPVQLSRFVDRVQGGDLRPDGDGATGPGLWLSTDDEGDGIYHVDLTTGAVTDAGSPGRIEGEGEGIDATTTPAGDLHVITVGGITEVWLIHLRLGAS